MTTKGTLKNEVEYFSDNWSGHGFHRIIISKNVIKKLFYTGVFISCIVLFGIQIRKLLLKYLSYPVNTVIEIHHDPILFPAVTFCNKNVVRRSQMSLGGSVLQAIVNKSEERFSSGEEYNYNYYTDELYGSGSGSGDNDSDSGSGSGNGTEVGSGDSSGSGSGSGSGSESGDGSSGDWSSSYYDYYSDGEGSADDEFFEVGSGEDVFHKPEELPWLTAGQQTGESQASRDISMALVKVNITSRLKMGHQLKEMLQSCSINGETCSTKNFSSFYNVEYGNCYTFNGMTTTNGMRTFKSGPAYGLNLQLVIEQDEYIGSLTRTAGARLTVHDPYEFPFPEDNGIDLSPGKLTSVGLKLKVMEKLGSPYSDCTYGRRIKVAYKGKYTAQACRKTCLQKVIVRECNCSDTRYSSAKFFKVRPCDNTTDYTCISNSLKQYQQEEGCECHTACKRNMYQQTVSNADFPSYASESELKEKIMSRSIRLKKLFNTTGNSNVMGNVLQVQVFFESLQYEKITELPAYDFETLLSDVGGQAGLLIGWSVITFVEVIEFLGNLLWVSIKSLLFRQKPGSGKIVKVAPAKS